MPEQSIHCRFVYSGHGHPAPCPGTVARSCGSFIAQAGAVLGELPLEFSMRPSPPPIVPDIDRDTYLVLDDFGGMGCAWRETNVQDTDLEAVIDDLWEGQYGNPVRVIGFNTAEGWSRDVSEDAARELRQRCADQDRELPDFLREFVERYEGPYRAVQLPLPIC
jgi:hypothetical protein